ncbi:MAG: Omp28-related outer membrane protein [bacterium]
MKKVIIIPALIISVLFTYECFSQARKYVLLEHFTNASCAPCASHNPVMDSTILKRNIGNIVHVAYHTVWPGVDPMNAYNMIDVADRVSYYGINGVPHVQLNGNRWNGMPAGVTQEMIDAESSDGSPLRITISETQDDLIRNVKVVVYTVGELLQATYSLRGLVLEKEINYSSAPGTNGETYFPNVFRAAFPSITGQWFTPAELGDSIAFDFSYTLDTTNWNIENIYSAAFVQNEATKEVINAVSTLTSNWGLTTLSQTFQKGSAEENLFESEIENFETNSKDFQITFTSEMPNDWSVEYIVNSEPSAEIFTMTLQPGERIDFLVKVSSGETPAVSSHTIKIQDLGNPLIAPQTVRFNVIRGVTDLIVNNDGSWGGTSSENMNCKTFEDNYINGLQYAGNSSYATTWNGSYIKGSRLGLLDEVRNVYYNMGWSFPALSNDNVAELTKFLDAGGNLFISGQDLGWEIFDTTKSSYSTPQKMSFYTNYLHSVFLGDGSTSNTAIIPNVNDVLFGTIPNGTLVNVYGSGENGPFMYPEEIRATATGFPIFYYNTFKTKTGAVRSNISNYKVVYLGFTLEQITNSDIRYQILATAHDWFYGLISSVEFDKKLEQLSNSEFYPNPSKEMVTLNLDETISDLKLEILNCLGQTLDVINLKGERDVINLDVGNYPSGNYLAKISSGNSTIVKTFVVIR